jgi:hypothetical protein
MIRKVLGITLFALGINFILNPVKSKPVEKPQAVMVTQTVQQQQV